MAIGRMINIGIIIADIFQPDTCELTMAIVEKNTITPTISSSAAIGISVLVTGPLVLNSFTIDRAGAGAVASAIPPNINPKYKGIPIK